MDNKISLQFIIDKGDFSAAGNASSQVKNVLKKLGVSSDIIRKASIAMYEGEINMVIHADGGVANIEISPEEIKIVLADKGKGISNIDMAMKEGYSTATEDIRNLGFGAGMGLPNMKKYTDFLNIESKLNVGTTVTMIIRINK